MIAKDSATISRGMVQSEARRRRWLLLGALLLVLLVAPFFLVTYITYLLFTVFLYSALGQAWNFLAGYTGLVSLGQAAFVGIGAYTATMVMRNLGLPMVPAALGGGLLATVFAAIISLAVCRFRGIYFAIGTLAVSEVLRLWMVAWPVTGGSQGLPVPLSAIPEPGFFYSRY